MKDERSHTELIDAVRMLATVVVAQQRLVHLAMGHCIALTPEGTRRDILNTWYNALGGVDSPPTCKRAADFGLMSPEIDRDACDLATQVVDAISESVGAARRT